MIIDVQGCTLILMPEPSNYTERLTGLHREIWEDVDTTEYLEAERSAWDKSGTDSLVTDELA